jgi:hypothetical protein
MVHFQKARAKKNISGGVAGSKRLEADSKK